MRKTSRKYGYLGDRERMDDAESFKLFALVCVLKGLVSVMGLQLLNLRDLRISEKKHKSSPTIHKFEVMKSLEIVSGRQASARKMLSDGVRRGGFCEYLMEAEWTNSFMGHSVSLDMSPVFPSTFDGALAGDSSDKFNFSRLAEDDAGGGFPQSLKVFGAC